MVAIPNDRRRALRRLDDLLEALEQLNLHEARGLPDWLVERLVEAGIEKPFDRSIPELIEQVWELQQPYLLTMIVDRRRRRRRKEAVAPATSSS